MVRIRRTAAATMLATMTCATPAAVTTARADASQIGTLAYVTSDGALDMVGVRSDGSLLPAVQIGPITTVTAPDTVEVSDVVVAADGSRLGWLEQTFKPDATYGKVETSARVVIRNMQSNKAVTLAGYYVPLGFVGRQLVVSGTHARRVVMTPTPHFVTIHDGDAYPVATYRNGIVDVSSKVGGSNNVVERDSLRLTTFSGHHTLLHRYRVGTDYRSVAANADAVSLDGTKLLVERGNHQDFEGLGPSSTFDTYSLGVAHFGARHELGHYGTDKAVWRLAGATFVGSGDTPWLALHSAPAKTATGYAVRGVVVRYAGGRWRLERKQAIAVAGNEAGYVVIQPGTWDPVKNSPAGEYSTTPSGDAVLQGPGGSHPLSGIQGTQLLWIG